MSTSRNRGAAEGFACNMEALTPAERTRHGDLARALFGALQFQEELPSGYAFQLPADQLLAAAEWVSLERRCCPFFTCEIEQTRDMGPLRVRITGPEGIKDFIRAEFRI